MSVRQAELARRWGLTRTRICQYVRAGMPLESVEAAAAWRLAKYGKVSPVVGGGDGLTGDAQSIVEKRGVPDAERLGRSDLDGVLSRAEQSEMEAYREFEGASGSSKLRKERQRIYQQAAITRIQVEKQVAEARLVTGELLTLDQARAVVTEALEPLDAMLKALPAGLAHRVNPENPGHARVVLQEEVDRIRGRLGE